MLYKIELLCIKDEQKINRFEQNPISPEFRLGNPHRIEPLGAKATLAEMSESGNRKPMVGGHEDTDFGGFGQKSFPSGQGR